MDITTNEVRERLADEQHEIWSHWMRYMFSQGKIRSGNWIVPQAKVERWIRQMNTPYAELTNREQEKGRHQADKVIKAVKEVMPDI